MLTVTLLALFVAIATASVLLDGAWTETARLRLLVEMDGALDRASTTDEIVKTARDYGDRLFNDCDGAIYLTSPRSPLVLLAGWWGAEPLDAGFGCARLSIRRFDSGADPSVTCIRLRAAGETVGFLTFTNRHAATVQLDGDAAAFGERLAHALARVHLRQLLQQSDSHIFLTAAPPEEAGRDAA